MGSAHVHTCIVETEEDRDYDQSELYDGGPGVVPDAEVYVSIKGGLSLCCVFHNSHSLVLLRLHLL